MALFRNLWRSRKPERREPTSRDYERSDDDERGRRRAREHDPEDRATSHTRPGRRGVEDRPDPASRPAYGYAGEDGAALYGGDFDPATERARHPRATLPQESEVDAALARSRRHTAQRERGHRGRGPRGYRRSDERILEDICDSLTEDPLVDATDVEVTVKNGEATLDGTVTDRLSRRRAEDIADCASGVVVVINNLRLERRVRPEMMIDDVEPGPDETR
jgi:osmotically-inducible protein OsmY